MLYREYTEEINLQCFCAHNENATVQAIRNLFLCVQPSDQGLALLWLLTDDGVGGLVVGIELVFLMRAEHMAWVGGNGIDSPMRRPGPAGDV